MTYSIEIKPAAAKQIRKLPRDVQERIGARLNELALNPRLDGVKKLTNSELYRARAGDYRIIYQIQDNVLLVTVVRVGHRRDVYKN
ncbi:type II toxin-antitoxin system RelE family toxin [Scytonema sp. NUACC26]|uniref:type II toxin-antitoxin system RelE family toxin n=1 Tax=Scytonema sp. NUACC26 TaxID=3140176 RepID=UPI0034DC0169